MLKGGYFRIWTLLLVAFVLLATASAMVDTEAAPGTMQAGPLKLKSAGIAYALTKPATPPAVELAPAEEPIAEAVAAAAQVDSASQTILLIGDSMLEGLGPRLGDYCAANGHTLYSVIWYSSTSAVWGQSTRLKEYISRLNPTFVFISLGANELFVRDIKEKRRGYVEKIIADLGNLPYVWIGPPNWKPDTGINELVAEEVPAGCYFKSDGMKFDRSKDGAHPTRASAALWVDSIVRWMPEHCAHPILMNYPDQIKGKPKQVFVHSPQEK